MTDETLRDRLHRALDQGADPFQDEGLAGALAQNPAAAAEARALTRVDRELRGLGKLQRSDAARKAFAARVSRRLAGGPLRLDGDIASDLAVPTFDDDDAVTAPDPPGSGRAGAPAPGPRPPPAGAGEFSLERLGELETQPTEPPHVSTRQRRPPPGEDRISIPKVGRVLPPPPDLTLEPPTPETPPSEAPGPSGSGGWALLAAALFALLVVGGGVGFAVMGGFGADDAELAMNDASGEGVGAGPSGPGEDDDAPSAAGATDDDGSDADRQGAEEQPAEAADAEATGGDDDEAAAGASDDEDNPAADEEKGDDPDDGRSVRRRRRDRGEGTASARARRERSPREKAAPSGPLPQKPTRAQVLQSLRSVEPRVRACRETRGGIAQVRITVASSGRVRNAVVQGVFAGTPEGSCVARAVRRARFPKFKDDSFSVTYPFRL